VKALTGENRSSSFFRKVEGFPEMLSVGRLGQQPADEDGHGQPVHGD
jgi:hypothetical protein